VEAVSGGEDMNDDWVDVKKRHPGFRVIGILAGVAIGVVLIAIVGLFNPAIYTPHPVVIPMDIYELSENGYIGWGNENHDRCDQFFDFSRDDIQVSGQVSDDYIEIFIRDKSTGVMARIAGDNVSSLEMEVR
jgi:hypothetical protein